MKTFSEEMLQWTVMVSMSKLPLVAGSYAPPSPLPWCIRNSPDKGPPWLVRATPTLLHPKSLWALQATCYRESAAHFVCIYHRVNGHPPPPRFKSLVRKRTCEPIHPIRPLKLHLKVLNYLNKMFRLFIIITCWLSYEKKTTMLPLLNHITINDSMIK